MINIRNQLTLSKADCPLSCGWSSSEQSKALKAKTELSRGKSHSVLRLQHRNSAWVFCLMACPSDSLSRIQHQLLPEFPASLLYWTASPCDHVSKFLKNKALSFLWRSFSLEEPVFNEEPVSVFLKTPDAYAIQTKCSTPKELRSWERKRWYQQVHNIELPLHFPKSFAFPHWHLKGPHLSCFFPSPLKQKCVIRGYGNRIS